jgi:hypothetical protein
MGENHMPEKYFVINSMKRIGTIKEEQMQARFSYMMLCLVGGQLVPIMPIMR